MSTAFLENRSRLPLLIWISSAIFILYGTTIPFQFVSDSHAVVQHLAGFRHSVAALFEPGHHVSTPDFISNIWLFMPFGCFGMWALRRPQSRTARLLLLTAMSGLLSLSVEFTQLFTADRISTASDVIANTAGGAFGALVGIVFRSTTVTFLNASASRGLVQATALYPLLVAALLLCAGAWQPFDVTIDIGSVIPKIKTFFADPVQRSVLSDEGISLMQHLFFSATLLMWLQELRVQRATIGAVAFGVIAAIGLEASQLFIGSRMPGLWDAAVGVIGALIGVALGTSYAKRPYSPIWPLALVAGTLVGVAIQQLSPFNAAGEPHAFELMPLAAYHQFTASEMISHAAELFVAYLPLGFGLALSTFSSSRRWVFPVAAGFAIALPIEYLQRFVGQRIPDVTDVAISVLGAAAGAWSATAGWQLFAADMRVIASHPATAGRVVAQPKALANARGAPGNVWIPPAIASAATIVAVVVGARIVLRLPGIPYNVRELFLDQASTTSLLFFAITLLWIGAGAMLLAHLTASARRPALVVPLALVIVCVISKMLLSRSVTYESIDDVIGSDMLYGVVTRGNAWGHSWAAVFAAVGADTVDFLERRVRYAALYSIPVVGITTMLAAGKRAVRARLVAQPVESGLLIAMAVLWLWLARTIVVSWAGTDNLTELLRNRPLLGIPGEWYLFGIALLIGLDAAFLLGANRRRWSVATAVTLASVPIGWWLLNAGLEPNVEKYGAVFSGAQFLLGPDRTHPLPATALFARWAAIQLGAVAVTFVGAWLTDSIVTFRAAAATSSRPHASPDRVLP